MSEAAAQDLFGRGMAGALEDIGSKGRTSVYADEAFVLSRPMAGACSAHSNLPALMRREGPSKDSVLLSACCVPDTNLGDTGDVWQRD